MPRTPERKSRPGRGGSDQLGGDRVDQYTNSVEQTRPALHLVEPTRPAWKDQLQYKTATPVQIHFHSDGRVISVDLMPIGFRAVQTEEGWDVGVWMPGASIPTWRFTSFGTVPTLSEAERNIRDLLKTSARPIYPPLHMQEPHNG